MTTLSMSKIRAAAVLAFAFASVSNALRAQAETQLVKVTVPFAFQAGSARFAPGACTLGSLTGSFLSIRGSSQSAWAMIRHDGGHQYSTVSQLVFHRYGDRYFLREVWIKGDPDHLLCPESKAERLAESAQQVSSRAAIAAHSNMEITLLEEPR
jgi:hypothetical protein